MYNIKICVNIDPDLDPILPFIMAFRLLNKSVKNKLQKCIFSEKGDLQALVVTLVGPTVTRPVQDFLAMLLLDNRLYINLELIKTLMNTAQSIDITSIENFYINILAEAAHVNIALMNIDIFWQVSTVLMCVNIFFGR